MKEIFQLMFPGLMLMWMFFNAQNLMSDIFIERDNKTLFRLSASTVTTSQFILSKILRVLVVCSISEFLLIVFTWLVFGVNWGNPLWLAIVLTSCNIAFIGVVAMIYALTKSLNAANGMATALILTFSIVGGSLMPLEEMPSTMQSIGSFTVNHQGITAIHALMDNDAFTLWLYPSLRLFIVGTVLICFASLRIHKRITAGEML